METLTEKVKRFLAIGYGTGYGYGDGSGYGDGDGSGHGDGDGYGYGYGDGSGYGDGDGSGHGDGDGYGYGTGDGSGYGSGHGVISFNGRSVYWVDGEPTLIFRVHSNVAHGAILNCDLTLTDCVIVRDDRHFAHGKTLQEAADALREKTFDDMDEEERIDAFMEAHPDPDKPVPNRELYEWHHRLTGSCELGRDTFVRDHGINLDGNTSVRDFLRLVRNSYGGEIIRRIEERIGS